jgi:adenylyltransferase/sulfurtransferase
MMHTGANLFKAAPNVGAVSRINELPIVGNLLLQSQVAQMSVHTLKQLLNTQASHLVLVDVRNANESAIAKLPGWNLVPYPEILRGEGIAKIKQLLENKRKVLGEGNPLLIVLCKAGVRSAKTLLLLQQAGITGINVTGGIEAWSQQIDPSIPLYTFMDSSRTQPVVTKNSKKKQLWLSGCGAAVALGTVGAVLAVRHNPDLLIPMVKAGVPLEWASNSSSVVNYALKRAHTPEMSAQELKQLIDSNSKDYLLVDVRTPEEYKLSRIPGAVLVPLTEIEKGSGIDKVKSILNGRRLIAYCTHGYRSGKALVKLQDAGIQGTQYSGGIKEWTEKIDPSLPRNNW